MTGGRGRCWGFFFYFYGECGNSAVEHPAAGCAGDDGNDLLGKAASSSCCRGNRPCHPAQGLHQAGLGVDTHCVSHSVTCQSATVEVEERSRMLISVVELLRGLGSHDSVLKSSHLKHFPMVL